MQRKWCFAAVGLPPYKITNLHEIRSASLCDIFFILQSIGLQLKLTENDRL